MITFAARKTTHELSENLGFYQFEAILGNDTMSGDYSVLTNQQLLPLQQNWTDVYPMEA
jgi:hypothetical protein